MTKDYTLQLLALQMGIPVEDYTTDQTLIAENYKGYKTLTVPKNIIDKLYSKKNRISAWFIRRKIKTVDEANL